MFFNSAGYYCFKEALDTVHALDAGIWSSILSSGPM